MEPILLTRGLFAIVDDEDYKWLNQWRWYIEHPKKHLYYAVRKYNNKKIRMHNLIMKPPEGKVVDHISRNGLDNRKENLRLCTLRENCYNSRLRITNTSGYKGVIKQNGKWSASVSVNRKPIFLGYYDSPIMAARAYDSATRYIHGVFAYLNFPELPNIKPKLKKRSSSKHKGVWYRKNRDAWIAEVKKNNKRYYIGYFKDEIDAAMAYEEKRREADEVTC